MTLHNSKLFFGVLLISLFCYSARGQQDDAKVEPLIVGGNEAVPHEFPFILSLLYKGQHICGGSIINETCALTANHCTIFDPDPRHFRVMAGAHDLNSFSEHHQIRHVKSIHIHHKYSAAANMDSDICMLTLDSPFVFNERVKSIKMAEPNQETLTFPETLTVAGWGLTKDGGNPSSKLQKVDVPFVEHDICVKKYNEADTKITGNMICYGNGERDSCQGDSGGPLIMKATEGSVRSEAIQFGIVSFGIGCADPNFPGVYTNVGNYIPWIQSSNSDEWMPISPSNMKSSQAFMALTGALGTLYK